MTDWRYYLVSLGGAVGGTLLLFVFVSGDPLVQLVALLVLVPTLFGIFWLWRREPLVRAVSVHGWASARGPR